MAIWHSFTNTKPIELGRSHAVGGAIKEGRSPAPVIIKLTILAG